MDTRNDLLFAQENGYSIYQYHNDYFGVYYLCIPDNHTETYEMFIGFPKRDLRGLSKEEIADDIREINDMIHAINKSGIYAIPNIDLAELEEAAKDNDDKLYNELLRKIQSMTFDINNKLNKDDIHNQSIHQVISIIKQTESDTKFINWLEMNMPNFIHSVTLDKLKKAYYSKVISGKVQDDKKDMKEVMNDPTKELDDSQESDKNNNELTNSQKNSKVRKLIPPKDNNNFYGFNSIQFIILTLIIALIIGISIGYLIIK